MRSTRPEKGRAKRLISAVLVTAGLLGMCGTASEFPVTVPRSGVVVVNGVLSPDEWEHALLVGASARCDLLIQRSTGRR